MIFSHYCLQEDIKLKNPSNNVVGWLSLQAAAVEHVFVSS
jgi:hypothetical protein